MGGGACKVKIILNGGAIQDAANRLCYLVSETDEANIPYDDGIEIVKMLNQAEDLMFKAQRKFLESQDFHGPWPQAMELKKI